MVQYLQYASFTSAIWSAWSTENSIRQALDPSHNLPFMLKFLQTVVPDGSICLQKVFLLSVEVLIGSRIRAFFNDSNALSRLISCFSTHPPFSVKLIHHQHAEVSDKSPKELKATYKTYYVSSVIGLSQLRTNSNFDLSYSNNLSNKWIIDFETIHF